MKGEANEDGTLNTCRNRDAAWLLRTRRHHCEPDTGQTPSIGATRITDFVEILRRRHTAADATKGIGDFFARRVHTQEICTQRSDGVEVCASGDQLAEILSASEAAGTPSAGSAGHRPDDDTGRRHVHERRLLR